VQSHVVVVGLSGSRAAVETVEEDGARRDGDRGQVQQGRSFLDQFAAYTNLMYS
jgi:hypothetical protein